MTDKDATMTDDEIAIRAAINVLRDTLESRRMPSGLPRVLQNRLSAWKTVGPFAGNRPPAAGHATTRSFPSSPGSRGSSQASPATARPRRHAGTVVIGSPQGASALGRPGSIRPTTTRVTAPRSRPLGCSREGRLRPSGDDPIAHIHVAADAAGLRGAAPTAR